MTEDRLSPYSDTLRIVRNLTRESLVRLMKDLEAGNVINITQTCEVNERFSSINAILYGYGDNNRVKVKLTNDQRRKFIRKGLKILEGSKWNVINM